MELEQRFVQLEQQISELTRTNTKLEQQNIKLEKQLEQLNNKLEQRISELTQTNTKLEQRIAKLEQYLKPINEQFYQTWLEKIYNGTHQRNEHGINDIETDTELIEIKHWKSYKHVYGQLDAYDPQRTKKWIVYLFGKPPQKTDVIINYFKMKSIELWKLEYDRETAMVFRDCLNDLDTNEDIKRWLNKNIIYIQNYLLDCGPLYENIWKGLDDSSRG